MKFDFEYAVSMCKMGDPNGCCRFLMAGKGFQCGKAHPYFRELIESRKELQDEPEHCDGINRMIMIADDPSGMKEGDIVFSYEDCTYGVISDEGTAVTKESGRHPFFEVRAENVKEYPYEMSVE